MISEIDARAALAAHLGTLHHACVTGYSRYQKKVAPGFAAPTRRTRASALCDLIVEQAEAAFAPVKAASVIRAKGRSVLRIVGLAPTPILIIFKKLGDRMMPQNLATQTSLAFMAQQPLGLFGDDVRLTVGHRCNQVGELRDVHLLLTNGSDRPAWIFELVPSAIPVAVLPTAHAAPKRPRLKPKTGAPRGSTRRATGARTP